jgi:phosphatidylinositol alpha 1,6-mannosyltransferase
MTTGMPRIAFLPDSFHEVNGVAHTARQFVGFARRRDLPMLCIRAGGLEDRLIREGSVEILQLDRGHWSVRLEEDLSFDPFFFRHVQAIGKALRRFKPDVIHITGPSELGIFGAIFAWRLGVPLVASWHTNVHEYAGRRLVSNTPSLGAYGKRLGRAAEAGSLAVAARFYRAAKVLYAPNPALCDLLQARTGRPCHLMQRGVDTELFSPAKRKRGAETGLRLGFVGRLSVEKNVDLLPRIDRQLRGLGLTPQWLIVGHGAEERSLRQQLGAAATFTGVLRGEVLAEAYANMDLLVFPSHTDTFGNVVLEALASGVPAVVTPDGGPAHIVQDGMTGCVAPDEAFADAIAGLAASPDRLAAMGRAARAYALGCSWDAVFERVLAAYPVA